MPFLKFTQTLVLTDQKQIPQWLVNGITYLIPKSDKTNTVDSLINGHAN